MFLSFVIPAFNEENRLLKTIHLVNVFLKAKYPNYEIIIVDDGSTDGTLFLSRKLAQKYSNIQVITYDKNFGKGYAVKTGVLSSKGDFIFFMDADGSTPIEELPKFLEKLESGADVVIGSRHLKGSDREVEQPFFRRMFGRLANLLIQFVLLPGITDSQCGFKGFKRDVALTLFREQEIYGWGFDFEILALARRYGFSIVEVPVRWLHAEGSRMRPFRSAFYTLRELIKVRLRLLMRA